jgi:hypothetical protein
MPKKLITFDPQVRPIYSHLEVIVDALLDSGNHLVYEYRWGENRTGFYCHLAEPLDFALLESTFELPSFVKLNRQKDSIDCHQTWTLIVGSVSAIAWRELVR